MQLMKRGFRQMAINLRPMNPGASRMVGPAFTLRYIPAREDLTQPPRPGDPINAQRIAVEEAPKGSVVIVSTGGELRSGTFGDILAARMMVRGVAGIVSDGAMRDAPILATMNLPVFAVCPTAPPSMTTPRSCNTSIACTGAGVGAYPSPLAENGRRNGCSVPGAMPLCSHMTTSPLNWPITSAPSGAKVAQRETRAIGTAAMVFRPGSAASVTPSCNSATH